MLLTPGKLRDVVAEALGIGDQGQTVDVHLRNLREADLMSKAKRGRGAAHVNAADAANLIIAIAGSMLVKDTVSTVQKYGPLKPDPNAASLQFKQGRQRLSQRFIDRLPLLRLKADHSFSHAIETTLEALADTTFFPEPTLDDFTAWSRPNQSEYEYYISIRFYLSWAAISFDYGARALFHVSQLYGAPPLEDKRQLWDCRKLAVSLNMVTSRSVGLPSLTKIASALRENIQDIRTSV
jgi:hypothetical protein